METCLFSEKNIINWPFRDIFVCFSSRLVNLDDIYVSWKRLKEYFVQTPETYMIYSIM